jgi:hypothetical protein
MGKVYFEILKENLNGETYRELMDRAIPFINQKHKRKWIFQQDGARPHTSQESINYFTNKKINILKHPSNSPDVSINILELL